MQKIAHVSQTWEMELEMKRNLQKKILPCFSHLFPRALVAMLVLFLEHFPSQL